MRRMTTVQRGTLIRNAAVTVGNAFGLLAMTHETVSQACAVKTSPGTVRRYFPTKTELWQAALRHADASAELKRQGELVGVQ